jgi:hypothetical protein
VKLQTRCNGDAAAVAASQAQKAQPGSRQKSARAAGQGAATAATAEQPVAPDDCDPNSSVSDTECGKHRSRNLIDIVQQQERADGRPGHEALAASETPHPHQQT